MKTALLLRLALGIGGIGLLAACSTPEARIRRNADFFATLAPEQQQLIREGKIAIGFTPDLVRLALGDPDRVAVRQDTTGEGEAWSYTNYETLDGAPLYRGWYHRYGGLRDPLYRYPYYLNTPVRRERDVFRVVFRAGSVVLIEQDSQR
jgi:hypothetical protein